MRSFGAAISMRLFRRSGEEKPGAVLSSGIGAGGRAAARPAGIWQRRRGGNSPRIYCGVVVVYSLYAKLAAYKRV